MTESLLEFPCSFPIKAFGSAELGADSFAALVFELVQPHVNELRQEHLSLNPSKNGRFVAVTINITATSQQQLDAIYQTLSAHERVVMSL